MKNITRRGFLQLMAATALVCATAPLTGCGKKNKKKLIIGTWYRQGSDDLAFTIYASLNSHVAKISSDGSYEYLS